MEESHTLDDHIENGPHSNPRPFVGPGAEQAPPVHEAPEVASQPLQEIVTRLERTMSDVGGLISRTDQLEASVRRVDRQVIMVVGILVLVLYTSRRALEKLDGIETGG